MAQVVFFNSPPLIKTVDLPHDTLNEDLVFIHGCKDSREVRNIDEIYFNTVSPNAFNSPISTPRVYGESFLKMIEFVGLFPWNTCAEEKKFSLDVEM